jgi:methylated-DNA-[protein]-cysteine S-methyltransferase
MKTTLGTGTLETPVGDVRFAVAEDGALVALAFADHWDKLARWIDRLYGHPTLAPSPAAAPVGEALAAYLAGDVASLDAVRVALRGTGFQLRVWAALRAIPHGATCSYGDIALAIGAPRAVRAVGAANGANPVSIVVPCHRVIGSGGALTGYGGGIERKVWLLEHEARFQLPPSPNRQTPMPLQPFAGGGQLALVQQRCVQKVPLTA